MAINMAQAEVKQSGNLSVPLALRNAPTKLMKEIGYGKEYQYSHNGPSNFVAQEFMPAEVANTKFYDMGENPRERELRERMKRFWQDKYGY